MIVLKLIPVILSFLLLGAHFSRAGMFVLAIICVALPFLLLIKKHWVALGLQILLVLGAVEWFRTLYQVAVQRQEMGEPWLRMAIILGVVGLFTGLSALIFQLRAFREQYKK